MASLCILDLGLSYASNTMANIALLKALKDVEKKRTADSYAR